MSRIDRPTTNDSSRVRDVEFHRLLNKLPAGAYTCDADGLITYYNTCAVELWGREPKLNDPVDRYCGSFRLFAVDGSPLKHDQCWMARAITENCDFQGEEIIVERPDGSRLAVLAHASPIHDEAGRLLGAVNVLVDVTERRRAEEAQLRAQQALERADRRKDEFLAMLSHELRNPLAPLRNAAVLLGMDGLDSRSAGEARDIMLRQVDHLSRLVDDLLDVSRIMQGKIELRREPVELAEVVRRAVEASQPMLLQCGHEFTISLPQSPIWLHADAVRLAQVFSNLLNNAARFTPPGGHIRLSATCEADDVAVHVRDNGAGIESDLLPHVFDMFVQGDKSIDRTQGGLGIGLTLVRSLIELHDGSVVVRSEAAGQGGSGQGRTGQERAAQEGWGPGTEFVVRLPSLHGSESTVGRCDDPPSPPVRPLRVLVVEDNVGAAKILARLLEKFWEHEVRTAFHGLEAMAAVDEFHPELVLCDIGLPHINGYDVARRMRARPEFHGTLLVALTGYGTEDDRRRSADAGFDLHLVKPAGVESLQRLFDHPKLAAAPPC